MNNITQVLTSTSFSGIYNTISEVNTHLSIPEKLWATWYAWWRNDTLATGIMSFVMHEFVYFGRSIPWIIIDAFPYFRRWKLQDTKIPTIGDQWTCTKYVLLQHFTVELPQIYLFHPIVHYFGLLIDVPFPDITTMAWQIAIFFVMEDTFHYWAHRGLHWGPLYKNIHKIHHQYSAPFGLAAEYAHPAEVFILGLGTVGSPILFCAITHNLHLITMYLWITLRLFQAIDAHSGYDFPWSLNKFIPFWAGADHHDFHHQAFVNNFSTSFRWWDWSMSTDTRYRAFRKRQVADSYTQEMAGVETPKKVD